MKIHRWMVAALFVLIIPLTVEASNYSFYGSTRVSTWYMDGRGWNVFYPDKSATTTANWYGI